MTTFLRKNIGIIIAGIGFFLLCILTFGDLGEIMSEEYWKNVSENLTSIGFTTVGLTLVQASIRQGLAEQALQRGLNTDNTTEKYKEHKKLIKDNNSRIIYLPYFLQIYNNRHTQTRRRDFLIENNFCSETILFSSGSKKLIREYKQIKTCITSADIKWSTVDVIHDKNGKIITLDIYRTKRIVSGVISSLISMIGVTFLTGGLFLSPGTVPLWQKFVKLFSYILCIALGGIFTVIKEYEKGAFGVSNELEEINQIWQEFSAWTVPTWVLKEIETFNNKSKEVDNGEDENTIDNGRDLQEKQEES